jgi:long-chain acyl-CoA synthetase
MASHRGHRNVIDAEGFIHITDRKKHLFVSSGGKNIAPQPIESLFLSNKYIEQFMLIGDRRMFLTALIVPDFDALREYADSRGITYATNTDLAAHPTINELIQDEHPSDPERPRQLRAREEVHAAGPAVQHRGR